MAADSDEPDAGNAAETDADGGGATARSSGPTCPHCDGELFKRHCKYVCPQHGVIFDCADTFWT
ncbi:HVO_2523 family zinc finger protein [Haloterrigena salifodinae]|uniref:Small CPxCG-related zinc finger protein n=1 Tax=Haloterrigena salifodinae TaxID=2675099 RepID=A0A8T8E081_9EURY|nr:HVO_2523 family zinc finger protein [Haloterrigena salifodinae]QRV14821.1 hypothetical protein JMJ58_18165 [Haloterrigena salifodinae]